MITDVLPPGDIAIVIIKLLWIASLIPSYPLVIYPTNMVVESYFFISKIETKATYWLKNIIRI
jgi:hypothetical protein